MARPSRWLGSAPSPSARIIPLPPPWSDLLSRLPAGLKWQKLKWRITSVARFCSALGITPEQISDAVLNAYRAELEKRKWAGRRRIPIARSA